MGINRIGFAMRRGYGNAVCRNKCKRYSREAYRLLQHKIRIGYDMILMVQRGDKASETLGSRLYLLVELYKKANLFIANDN